MMDYHLHCSASFDSFATPEELLLAASSMGIKELCFTDHIDFEYEAFGLRSPAPCDIAERARLIADSNKYGLAVRMGAEVGLCDFASAQRALAYINEYRDFPLDFIIGSVHICDGADCYYPEYFLGKSKRQAYRRYIEQLCVAAKSCSFYSVLGHYDFCAKYAPYADRRMEYGIAPDAFDEIFRYAAHNGKGIEVNTSAWRNGPPWGLDILRRYRELGGEIITVGSDAHTPERVGNMLSDAVALIETAGFEYIAAFKNLEPFFIPIDEVIY